MDKNAHYSLVNKTVLIRYPRFNQLYRDICECQEMSQLLDEPQCMALEGVTGVGKSTLVQNYVAMFPRIEQEDGTHVPIFYAQTPSPVTVKGMAATMLARLGDPAAHRGTLWSMNFRLIKLMIACQVEIAIIDDFHHLIDKETNCVIEKVSDWLKVLIKETGVNFIVVGISGKVERILQANAQLSRLFAVRETLEPFQYNPADEASIREFARFIQYAEKTIETTLSTTMSKSELLYLLHYATDGIVGNLMNLLRYAALIASKQCKTSIDIPILAKAFDKRLSKHLREKINPFKQIGFVIPSDNSTISEKIVTKKQCNDELKGGGI